MAQLETLVIKFISIQPSVIQYQTRYPCISEMFKPSIKHLTVSKAQLISSRLIAD